MKERNSIERFWLIDAFPRPMICCRGGERVEGLHSMDGEDGGWEEGKAVFCVGVNGMFFTYCGGCCHSMFLDER